MSWFVRKVLQIFVNLEECRIEYAVYVLDKAPELI